MKKFIAILLSSAILFTGCSGGGAAAPQGSSGGSSTTPEQGTTAQDNSERSVKLRLISSLPSLDWEQTTNTKDMKVWHQMYEGLYGMDEAAGGYYKELAEDVQLSDDQLVYTITLVPNVKFQNGEPLKASDVAFSYDRAMKNSRFNYLTSMIDKVEAVDDGTVKVTLNQPYSPIDHTFFCIKILSEKEVTEQGDKFGTVPHKAGTGPYYVTDYDVATGLKLKAFEDYWRGPVNIKGIEYSVISDDSAATIAYQNGELDYLEDAPLADWENLKRTSGENNTVIKGNNIMVMEINYQSPTNNNVLGNDKVRQAIFYAINKEDANMAVSDGYGTPATEYMPSDYVPTSPSSGFETYDFDLEKAKQLLAEAGYPDGVDVGTIMAYGAQTSASAKLAQVIQANLAKAGITAAVEVAEAAIVTPKLYAQEYDIGLFNDSGNYDFNNIRQQVHSESVGMYLVKYKDGKFNWQRIEELIDLGATTSDPAKRLEYYTELWSIIADTATINPILHRPVAIVWNQDLDISKAVPTYYKVRQFSWK